MTPEQLKGKEREFEDEQGFFYYYKPKDIKSAVEGCLEELQSMFPSDKALIKAMLKKWFHDVM